jgi:uncharacterized SAM-binding protein YcdF (DUF218 family)/glycosyltransferase involved in cell wall biosynthesis
MIRGQDILCISSLDWDAHWQIHHEIMAALAAQGNRVLYVENTGVRRPGLADLSRVRQRLRNWRRGTRGFRGERPGLFVYSPLFVPLPYSRLARWINRALLFRGLRRWMQAVGFGRPIVWTFLPTPLARDMIDAVDAKLVVYYCADDFSSSSSGARRVTASETRLLKEADVVFVTSERLRERAAALNPSVHRFPAGVDFDAFDRVRRNGDQPPTELQQLPRPIVGYVGGLHQWLEQSVIVALAGAMPKASIVLVGPTYADTSALAGQPNIHLLGERQHADVPRYIKGFDVGIVPYRLSPYTDSVYPVKLNEYLAMGIPVVATDLPEIRRFNADSGDLVSVAADAPSFCAAVERAVSQAAPHEVTRRVEAARVNSWPARIAAMSKVIEAALEARARQGERWEERLGRFYRRARRRTLQAVVGTLALYVLIFHTPLVWWLAAPLQEERPAAAADAIVVFAGGVGESGQAGGGYQERVKRAIDLYRAGYARSIVFSSGFVWAFQEAEIMSALAVENGVPGDAIVLEKRATNTHENVLYSAEILAAHGWRRILLVSSPYHMRRALLTWRRAAPLIEVIPEPVERSLFYAHSNGPTLEQIEGLAHEYAAIAAYWLKGWI